VASARSERAIRIAAHHRLLVRERLFEQAGITASHFGRPPPQARVTGAEPATVGDGGLWTTPVDLERWNEAMNASAFGAATQELAERPGRLKDGSLLANGWGVGIVKLNGRVFFHRGGEVEGWTTKVVRERMSGTSVVLSTDGAPSEIVHNMAFHIAAEASAVENAWAGDTPAAEGRTPHREVAPVPRAQRANEGLSWRSVWTTGILLVAAC
jgi:hypothetical protein